MLLGIHKFRIVFSLSQSPKIRSKTIDPINKREKLTKKIFIVTKRFWVWIIKRIKAIISESNINRIIMFDKPRWPSKSKNKTHEIGLIMKTKKIHKPTTSLLFELSFWTKANIFT